MRTQEEQEVYQRHIDNLARLMAEVEARGVEVQSDLNQKWPGHSSSPTARYERLLMEATDYSLLNRTMIG